MLIISTYNKHPIVGFEPDFYEYRLDLTDDWFFIPNLYNNKKTILTLRDKDEGGLYTDTLEKKIEFYVQILENTDFYIDIELRNCLCFFQKVKKEYLQRIIVSVHDCSVQDSIAPLPHQRRCRYDDDTNKNILNFKCFFFKFVYKINSFLELLNINETLQSYNINYTFLSIGNTSIASRTLYKQLGSVATYIGEKGFETAPNQLTHDIYEKFNYRKDVKIGGIIGGKQVLNSKGLDFYNNYFKENNINAVYLPFVIEDLNDFIGFVKSSGLCFYGFSITMPFKKEFRDVLPQDPLEVINLWIPYNNRTYLTDKYAFEQAFKKLGITNDTKVVLLGSGAMAETVIQLLLNNEIYIYARNEEKVISMIENHKNMRKGNDVAINGTVCLINTTPLGMYNENVLDTFPINNFNFAIDLPYQKEKTKLIEHCETNKIPYVDGIEFWELQAKQQMEVFLDRI